MSWCMEAGCAMWTTSRSGRANVASLLVHARAVSRSQDTSDGRARRRQRDEIATAPRRMFFFNGTIATRSLSCADDDTPSERGSGPRGGREREDRLGPVDLREETPQRAPPYEVPFRVVRTIRAIVRAYVRSPRRPATRLSSARGAAGSVTPGLRTWDTPSRSTASTAPPERTDHRRLGEPENYTPGIVTTIRDSNVAFVSSSFRRFVPSRWTASRSTHASESPSSAGVVPEVLT